jgi:hypothetical protein
LHLSPPTECHIALAPPESPALARHLLLSYLDFGNSKIENGKTKSEKNRKAKSEKRKWKVVALLAEVHFPFSVYQFPFSGPQFQVSSLSPHRLGCRFSLFDFPPCAIFAMFFAMNDVFCLRNTVGF